MSSQEYFIHGAQGESLLKFGRTPDQADPIMLRGRMQPGIERQIVGAIRRREHVQVVTIKVSFACAVPAGVAVGLGIQTRMAADKDTAGTAKTSRSTSGINGGHEWCAITGRGQCRKIPEDSEACRN